MFHKLFQSREKTLNFILSLILGLFVGLMVHYYLYRIGLPLQPFIYQAF